MDADKKKIYKVVVADDHPVIWNGIRLLVEEDARFQVLYCARDGAEVFGDVRIKECDILILDIGMPRMDGFSVLKKIRADYPEIKTLIFTMHTNLEFFRRCVGMGAQGFVLKNDPPETLKNALLNMIQGKMGISPSISPMKTGEEETDKIYDETLRKLTPREREVLSLVASGLTSRDIARTLNVKKTTVDKHRENIRGKLGTVNFSDLLYLARKNRLI